MLSQLIKKNVMSYSLFHNQDIEISTTLINHKNINLYKENIYKLLKANKTTNLLFWSGGRTLKSSDSR